MGSETWIWQAHFPLSAARKYFHDDVLRGEDFGQRLSATIRKNKALKDCEGQTKWKRKFFWAYFFFFFLLQQMQCKCSISILMQL